MKSRLLETLTFPRLCCVDCKMSKGFVSWAVAVEGTCRFTKEGVTFCLYKNAGKFIQASLKI